MSILIHHIPFLSADALTQMATDIELAELCNRQPGRAFCRFYQMDPPAVTIGRNQAWRSVIDEGFCHERGFHWVRRPTGGGALLHHLEVNYAVAASFDAFDTSGNRDFRAIFERVMTAIATGLELMGCQPILNLGRHEVSEPGASSAHGLCERSLTRYEIEVDGKKAVAAAQRNLANAFLQHGTIYLKAPGPEDRFWGTGTGHLPQGEASNWWGLDQIGSLPPDPINAITSAMRDGFARSLEVEWNDLSGPAVSADALRACKKVWELQNWNHAR